MAELKRQALLQIARAHADRIEALQKAQRALDFLDRPRPHPGQFVDRGDEIAVVIEIADDGFADLSHQLVVVGLDRELPAEMIGERCAGRERVLDRRQLAHFLRRAWAVAVVQVLAEEVLVVLIVPGVGLLLLWRFFFFGLLLCFSGLEILGGDLFEQGVLDHLLVEQIRQLQRGHRQQLDRLLQRWRQNEFLRQSCLQLLLYGHVVGSYWQGMRRANSHLTPQLT